MAIKVPKSKLWIALFMGVSVSLTGCISGGSDSSSDTVDEAEDTLKDGSSDGSDDSGGGTDQDTTTAAGVSFGGVKKLSNDLFDAKNPAIAVDEGGNVLAAWVEQRNPASLWSSYYDASSDSLSSAVQVDGANGDVSEYGKFAVNPQVVFTDSTGNKAVAIWEQDSDIYTNVYTTESGWLGSPIEIATAPDDGFRPKLGYPKLGVLDNGKVVATWLNDVDKTVDYAIFDAENDTWSNPEKLSQTNVNINRDQIELFSGDDGDVHLMFVADDNEDGDNELHYRQHDGDGWQSTEIVATESEEGAFRTFDMANDPLRGDIAMAYATDNNIFLSRQDSDATAASRTSLQVEAGGDKYHPQIAAMSDGDLMAAYRLEDGTFDQLYAFQWDQGSGWEEPELVYDLDVEQPVLATDDQGRATILFHSFHSWFTTYVPGSGWTSPEKPFGYNDGENNYVTMLDDGTTVATWYDPNTGSGFNATEMAIGQ